VVDFGVGHAEIQDRVLLEIELVRHAYPKALEQLTVSPEKVVYCVNQEGLAESSGPGQKTEIREVEHFVNIFSLVNVKHVSFSDFLKARIAEWQLDFHGVTLMLAMFQRGTSQFLWR
jgi:hypothetical protein